MFNLPCGTLLKFIHLGHITVTPHHHFPCQLAAPLVPCLLIEFSIFRRAGGLAFIQMLQVSLCSSSALALGNLWVACSTPLTKALLFLHSYIIIYLLFTSSHFYPALSPSCGAHMLYLQVICIYTSWLFCQVWIYKCGELNLVWNIFPALFCYDCSGTQNRD